MRGLFYSPPSHFFAFEARFCSCLYLFLTTQFQSILCCFSYVSAFVSLFVGSHNRLNHQESHPDSTLTSVAPVHVVRVRSRCCRGGKAKQYQTVMGANLSNPVFDTLFAGLSSQLSVENSRISSRSAHLPERDGVADLHRSARLSSRSGSYSLISATPKPIFPIGKKMT